MTQRGQSRIYTEQMRGSTNKQTTMVWASGAQINMEAGASMKMEGAIDMTSGQVTFPPSLARGYIDLGPYLMTARVAASGELIASGSSAPTAFWGGLMMPDGTPTLNTLTTADRILAWTWASAIVTALKLAPIAMPANLATGGGLTIQLFGESVGTGTASDAAAGFDIRCWMGVGDTEMGATHPNFTSTPSFQGITLASGDITTDVLNMILVPSAHAGRAINLYGGRISYALKTS